MFKDTEINIYIERLKNVPILNKRCVYLSHHLSCEVFEHSYFDFVIMLVSKKTVKVWEEGS